MFGYESLYRPMTVKLKPKDSYSTIKKFHNKYKKYNNFIFLTKSYEDLYNLHQDRYLLQLSDGISYESFMFNIVKDNYGYCIYDNKEIRRFRNKNNALKYKISKSFLKTFDKYTNSVEVFCFKYNGTEHDEIEFINNSYYNGRRVKIK